MKIVSFTLALIFLVYQFFLLVFPTVMVDGLIESFKIDALQLGDLNAFFYYAYAPMQIPAGLLFDRYGTRLLFTAASLSCAIGCFLFAGATYLGVAEIGRLLIGLGSAFAFIGMVFVCAQLFPENRRAFLIGFGNSVGMLGSIGGQGPLADLVERFGWRAIVNGFGFFGIGLSILIFFLMGARQSEAPKRHHVLKNLLTVIRHPKTWINGIIALLFYATTAGFAAFWGVRFLVKTHGMSIETAAYANSMIFLGWILAGPLWGRLSDRLNSRKLFLFITALGGALSIGSVVFFPALNHVILFLLLFLVGFFSAGELLCFSLAISFNPFQAKGTASSLTNFIVSIGGAGILVLLGGLIDEMNLEKAFAVLPLTFLLAFFLLFFLREKPGKLKTGVQH